MKKKVITLIMAAVLVTSAITGCGKEAATSTPAAAAATAGSSTQTVSYEDDSAAAGSVKEYENNSYITNDVCSDVEDGYYYSDDCYESATYDDYYVDDYYVDDYFEDDCFDTSEFSAIKENGFSSVSKSPLSTFGADVDTASYSTLRSYIDWGYSPKQIPTNAIRTEELLNYFNYDYEGPKGDEPFGVNAEISDCPWNEDSKLLMLGLQTEAIDFSDAPASNIVFLIDVSGSMYDENKLPLLKKSFGLLIDNLGKRDRVSIVTYAGCNQVVLEGVPGSRQDKIMNALDSLEAYGSTNGGQGIISAYELAEEYFIEGGNNRVILATDGDFNVGITKQSDLLDLIDKEKETGVFLSVLGFGMGNYSDTNMETLADHGNGNYAYIDSITEAKKVLVENLGATMVTVAKDVKLQVEFNPNVVSEYRLIGYENRAMAAEDFADDSKDGGEIGAGHSVTVLYELVLTDDDSASDSDLKYQSSKLTDRALDTDEWLTLSVRYKEPDKNKSKLLEYPIGDDDYTARPSDDFKFASCVAEFSMLLRNSEYAEDSSYRSILKTLNKMDNLDEYKEEFIELVEIINEYDY